MSNLIISALIVVGLALSPPINAQDVYRWVDEDGKYRYSDKPRPGAKLVLRREIPYIVPLGKNPATGAGGAPLVASGINNTAKLKPLIKQQRRCAKNRNRLAHAQSQLIKRQQQGMPDKSRQFYQKLVTRYQTKVTTHCG